MTTQRPGNPLELLVSTDAGSVDPLQDRFNCNELFTLKKHDKEFIRVPQPPKLSTLMVMKAYFETPAGPSAQPAN